MAGLGVVQEGLQARPPDALDRRALALTGMRQASGVGASGREMHILIVSDGVPGHDRSSFGILSALQKFRSVEAVFLPVQEARGGSRRVKRTLACLLPFEPYWRAFYRIGERISPGNPVPITTSIPTGRIDLVISTGPATAAANIALARRLGAKNIYFGFPKWPGTGGFLLLLTPVGGRLPRNVAYALRPSDLDAELLPEARPLIEDGAPRKAALLFGGDSKHYRYTNEDMEILAERLVGLSEALPWLSWTVFDSRRTPEAPLQRFVHATSACRSAIQIVRYAQAGLLSNQAAFASDLVLVTADSMSMISESIAARRPTGILFADDYRPPKRDADEHAWLLSEQRAFSLRFSDLTHTALLSSAPHLRLICGSQLDALHALLVRAGI
jgi:uncharacterized protein